jgi:hypothetical protein
MIYKIKLLFLNVKFNIISIYNKIKEAYIYIKFYKMKNMKNKIITTQKKLSIYFF